MRILFVTACLLVAAPAGAAPPLFESTDTMSITVEAPMRDLIRQRKKKPEVEAVVTYTDASGTVQSVPARLKPRGNHRLATCRFPPLLLKFDKDSVAGTIFEGHRRIKMVTRCDRGYDNEAWLKQEYGIYRAFNAVTDHSYRVRMLDVTYQDSESKRWKRQHPAFFIEPDDAVAARHGLVSIRPASVRPDQFDEDAVMNTLLFQYLIGNTDFAVLKGPKGEGCCHNGRIIAPKGSDHGWIAVPYDFDQAGVINTDYALPDLRLGIREVRTRLYRGFCWNNPALPAAIERFNAARDEITDALVPDDITSSRQRRISGYVDDFYEVINDQEELQEEILDKCRGAVTFEIRETRTAEQ